jgi:hypothetical protein
MLVGDPPPAGAEVAATLTADGVVGSLPVALRVVHVREVATGDYLLGARFTRPLAADEMAPYVTLPSPAGRELPKKG